MEKRSVLFINDSLWSGSGVFRSLQQVLRLLDYDKYDVTLFVYPDGEVEREMLGQLPPALHVVIGEDPTHYYRRPTVALLHSLSRVCAALHIRKAAEGLQKRARRLIRKKKNQYPAKRYFRGRTFDVIVANTVPLCAETARYIRGKKKYVLFHSSQPTFFPAETAAAFRCTDGVIAVSEGVREMLEQAYPQYADRIRTITNYVDAAAILEKAKRGETPARSNAPVLCSCGRLSREKGFDLAVDAAALLKQDGYAFIWYFVGDGPERALIERKSKENGLEENVRITGMLKNPFPYIAICDIYVQPSYEEAQPLAVMEAQILGRAIVSTETVGGKTILENGKKGVLTPITAQGLAAGIETLLRDPAYRASFENLYIPADDQRNKRQFANAWDRLLSE